MAAPYDYNFDSVLERVNFHASEIPFRYIEIWNSEVRLPFLPPIFPSRILPTLNLQV